MMQFVGSAYVDLEALKDSGIEMFKYIKLYMIMKSDGTNSRLPLFNVRLT